MAQQGRQPLGNGGDDGAKHYREYRVFRIYLKLTWLEPLPLGLSNPCLRWPWHTCISFSGVSCRSHRPLGLSRILQRALCFIEKGKFLFGAGALGMSCSRKGICLFEKGRNGRPGTTGCHTLAVLYPLHDHGILVAKVHDHPTRASPMSHLSSHGGPSQDHRVSVIQFPAPGYDPQENGELCVQPRGDHPDRAVF